MCVGFGVGRPNMWSCVQVSAQACLVMCPVCVGFAGGTPQVVGCVQVAAESDQCAQASAFSRAHPSVCM